jgi:hypothetical protein
MNTASRRRLFTVEEANQRLPLVRAIVTDIVKLYEDVHDRRERLSHVRQSSSGLKTPSMYSEEVQQIEDELEKDIERLEQFANELEELGVELKDPVMGLVDFRSLLEGREVYLCWRLGEEEITHWHELNSGFQGRQSLLEDSLFTDGLFDEDTPTTDGQ